MKMKMIFTAGTLGLTMALTGCANSDGPHGGHTEKWYEQHAKARAAEIDWCRSTKSTRAQERGASCQRAMSASLAYWNSPAGIKAQDAQLNRMNSGLAKHLHSDGASDEN